MSTHGKALPIAPSVDFVALGRFLTALGDPTRQAIVVALAARELNVGELTERFDLSRPAISHQLKVLADAGLLRCERRGRERVYRVDGECCRTMAERLKSFVDSCCGEDACCT